MTPECITERGSRCCSDAHGILMHLSIPLHDVSISQGLQRQEITCPCRSAASLQATSSITWFYAWEQLEELSGRTNTSLTYTWWWLQWLSVLWESIHNACVYDYMSAATFCISKVIRFCNWICFCCRTELTKGRSFPNSSWGWCLVVLLLSQWLETACEWERTFERKVKALIAKDAGDCYSWSGLFFFAFAIFTVRNTHLVDWLPLASPAMGSWRGQWS